MILIDTHTHLYSDKFSTDVDEVIARAKKNKVHYFFLPAIDSEHTQSMYDLEKKYPEEIGLMMGLHPTSVQKETYLSELKHVEDQFLHRDFCAVGEIGIDLYWDQSTLEIQKQAFKHQIKLAKSKKLPIIIHCRNAFDEVFEVLEEEKSTELHGIFHCFTGDLVQAKKAIDYQMKLGIGGVATFKNGKIDQFLNQIDLKHIVLETDSPYLAPSPHRGKRNESSYVRLIAEKVASLYAVSLDELAAITTKNAVEIFKNFNFGN